MENNSSSNSIWYDYGHHEGLDTETTYIIYGIKAKFCLFTNSLQVIFEFVKDICGERESHYLLQNFKINSREYNQFIDYWYTEVYKGVFEVNVKDITSFCYYGKLKYINEHYELDFNSLDPIATAVSDLYSELYLD